MNINEIIKRKQNDVDCVEAESAEIKGWLRDNEKLSLLDRHSTTLLFIIDLFPIEYSEFLEETKYIMSEKFKKLYSAGVRLFESTDAEIIAELATMKAQAMRENICLNPVHSANPTINDFCETCGAYNNMHPENSYCFICNTDNWEQLPEYKGNEPIINIKIAGSGTCEEVVTELRRIALQIENKEYITNLEGRGECMWIDNGFDTIITEHID